jgi:cysteine synthase A
MSTPTPLWHLGEEVYAKLEYVHPSGSIKHRSIPVHIEALARTGELVAGQAIVIRSAGSAAVTAAWAGARIGHPVIAVLPPTVPPNIVRLLRWFGAQCHVLLPADASHLVDNLRSRDGCYVLEQANEARLIDHYRQVAAEIIAELPATAITVGIGTGLSITGIAREVSDRNLGCQVYGVEPAEAPVASGGSWAPHGIPGLAPPIKQPLLDHSLLSGIVTVTSSQARQHARDTARRSGLPLGPSSGATVAAVSTLRERGVTGPIVAVCACSINDYLEDPDA